MRATRLHLAAHGITHEDVVDLRCVRRPGWRAFTSWWLDVYLPPLRAAAEPFLARQGLHLSVHAMRASCLARYARIERVLRACDADPVAFRRAVWRDVEGAGA